MIEEATIGFADCPIVSQCESLDEEYNHIHGVQLVRNVRALESTMINQYEYKHIEHQRRNINKRVSGVILET